MIRPRPSDAILLHLAKLANVRPPHVFHLAHTIADQRGRFNAVAYAAFAQMDLKHVERMVAVFKAEGLLTPPEPTAAPARGERLPADFQIPSDWIAWAITQRAWTQDVAETVAAEFCDYWPAQPGQKGVKLDWFATFRNWVRNSRKPNGERVDSKAPISPQAYREFCTSQLEYASQRGDYQGVRSWRRKLEAI